ncbi:MAG: hypothetical protein SPE58_08140 [Lactobacillus johnsonii]|nr:hypothetical protein [Clostridium sp.]MCI7083231.1 hypothetical protein [Mycoplasmatota bacterium]MDY5068689.1 hypothetical protein [Lactobacillus johnsonii]
MKKKSLISILLVTNLITAGTIYINRPIAKEIKPKEEIQFDKDKIQIEEAVIEKIKSTGRIEVCQNSLNQKTILSKYKDKKLFYNNLNLEFKGVCHNYINLSKSEVLIKGKEIIIVAKLEQEVEILNLTSKTEKGFLSLYTQELKAEEFNAIEHQVKERMLSESSTEENKSIIKNISEDKLENIVEDLINEKYEVKIISFC